MPTKKTPKKRAREQTASNKPPAKRTKSVITEEFLYKEPGGLPSPRDINQSRNRVNCYMLAPLISLARNNPNFIKGDLIKIENDKAKVTLHRCIRPRGRADKHIYKPGVEEKFAITSEQIESWDLEPSKSHYANWVKAVEIAYATLMKKCYPRVYSGSLKNVFEKGSAHSTEALVILTGQTARWDFGHYGTKRDKIIDKQDSEHFPHKFPAGATYNTYCQGIYDKIDAALKHHSIIVAEFQCIGDHKLSRKKLNNALKLDSQFKATFEKLLREFCDNEDNQSYVLTQLLKDKYHGFPKSIKIKQTEELFIKKVLATDETFRNSTEFKTIWQEKLATWLLDYKDVSSVCKKTLGMITDHAYSVVNCFEKDGYRYITLQNPYNKATYIDYSTSKYRPRTLPNPPVHPDGATAPNLFNMELAHFCKHLRYLNYTQ